jgi:hypothetical protein
MLMTEEVEAAWKLLKAADRPISLNRVSISAEYCQKAIWDTLSKWIRTRFLGIQVDLRAVFACRKACSGKSSNFSRSNSAR